MLSLKDIELGLKGPMESFPFIRLQSVAGWEINKGGQGGGGSHDEFTNNNSAFDESRNKYLRYHAFQNRGRTKV